MKYPFSPEILDAMPEEMAQLFRELEQTILKEIASRLKASGKLNEVTVQGMRVLRSHGISTEEIKLAIRKTTGIGREKLNEILNDVILRNQQYYTETLRLAGITMPETMVDVDDIAAIIKQTNEQYRNITRSMGFLVDSGRTMLPPAKAYQWALDNAAMQIQSGGISYNQAIANATRQLADSGLQYVEYESGWRNRVDVAVRRAVLTGVNQLNSKYDEQAMEEMETDLVEVSAHAGARDKGIGFQNHKEWQGKVYRWRRYAQLFPNSSKEYYPDFEYTCGYGDVQGILGANCRHKWVPFIEGVSERTYTDQQLATIDKPPFEYEGKKYTTYEATQKQRQIETAIRHWKRREAAAVTPEDKQAARARIRILNAKYKEFSEAAGLRMQPERMAVYKPGTFKGTEEFTFEIPSQQITIGTATTVEQVNEFMNTQGWFSTNRAGITSEADLTGCDLESAKSIAAAYQQVFEKYPQLIGKFKAPNAQPVGMKNNTYAWCYTRGGGQVQVNPNRYNDWSAISQSYERDIATNWHPHGTTAESIVTHEIGHSVDGLLAEKGILGGYTSSGEFRYASSSLKTTIMKRAAKIDELIADYMEMDRMWKGNEAVVQGVCRYAAESPKEWFAECFAEYITSANPRTVAAEFGKELEKLLEKVK